MFTLVLARATDQVQVTTFPQDRVQKIKLLSTGDALP